MSKIPWKKIPFTQAYLRSILRYEQETGLWFWTVDRSYRALRGWRAGSLNSSDGRWYLKINGHKYSASRLAWFYMTGKYPHKDVEHEDGKKQHNAWQNLRLATRTQNAGNSRARMIFKGVTQVRTGKYTAQIQKKLRKIHLGTFDTPEEAHAAYVAKAVKLHGKFARAR